MSYWVKGYQKKADEQMSGKIKNNFIGGNLIILRYAKPEHVPEHRVKRNWKAWIDSARNAHGENFQFIVGHNYGTREEPIMAHYVFLDLAAVECKRIAKNWYWGPATVVHLDEDTMDKILAYIGTRPVMNRSKNRQLWSESKKVKCWIPQEKNGEEMPG